MRTVATVLTAVLSLIGPVVCAAERTILFCYFWSVGRWSTWGSWGIMQHFDDNPAAAPKFSAAMRWAKQCGQAVTVPR